MIAWLRHHAHSLARSFARLAGAPLSSLLNVVAIGMALSLPVIAYVALQNLQGLAPGLQGQSQVTVFLVPGASRADAQSVEGSLRADSAVKELRFISKEAALAGLKRSPGLGEAIGVLRDNPLPDAYVATLASNDPEEAERIAGAARTLKAVAHAQADALWARRLEAMLQAGRKAVWLLGLVLGLALVAVTFNTIRLQILTDREEIEVSKLVGATDAYVRRPFLYWGTLLGALGGAAALGIGAAVLAALSGDVTRVSELYGASMSLRFLSWDEALGIWGGATLLGWTGSVLSVSIHLHEIRPR